MYHEPVTFDPAAKEIAQQFRLLVGRMRQALRARAARRMTLDNAS
jgi:hypothetical protein